MLKTRVIKEILIKARQGRKGLSKKKPEKKLVLGMKKRSGRSKSSGRVTVRHRGGGVKRRYRIVDFGQKKINIPAKILRSVDFPDPFLPITPINSPGLISILIFFKT